MSSSSFKSLTRPVTKSLLSSPSKRRSQSIRLDDKGNGSPIIEADYIHGTPSIQENEEINNLTLKPHEIDTIERTAHNIIPKLNTAEFWNSIFHKMYQSNPAHATKFPTSHDTEFVKIVRMGVNNINNLRVIQDMCEAIGRLHGRVFGVDEIEYFENMGRAFVSLSGDLCFPEELGVDDMDRLEVEMAWGKLYCILSAFMINGFNGKREDGSTHLRRNDTLHESLSLKQEEVKSFRAEQNSMDEVSSSASTLVERKNTTKSRLKRVFLQPAYNN